MKLSLTPRRIATPPDNQRIVIGFFFERNGKFSHCEPVYHDKSGLWRMADDLLIGNAAGLRHWADYPAMPDEMKEPNVSLFGVSAPNGTDNDTANGVQARDRWTDPTVADQFPEFSK